MIDDFDNGYDPYNSATTRKTPPVVPWLRNWIDPEVIAAMMYKWAPVLDTDSTHEPDRYRK
jgi:hypothetical protein